MAASKVSFGCRCGSGSRWSQRSLSYRCCSPATRPPRAPASQRLIAFARGDGVYVMHADGSGEHRILTHRGALYGGVAWSPDRSRLALATSEGIWVMGAAGQQLVGLATPGQVGMLDGEPYPSASRFRLPPPGHPTAGRSPLPPIRGMTATSGSPTPTALTSIGSEDAVPPFFEGGVDWSPAGDRLVFDSGSWVSDVYVMRTNGSSLRNLTPGGGSGRIRPPSWKPDGHKIVFAPANGIWIMEKTQRQLDGPPDGQQAPGTLFPTGHPTDDRSCSSADSAPTRTAPASFTSLTQTEPG